MSETEEPAPVTAPAIVEQEKAQRGARIWTWIARLTGVLIVMGVLAMPIFLLADRAASRAERLELLEQVDAERSKVDALYEQLRALGEDPVVEPGSEPAASTPGAIGPVGPQGVPGRDGRPPSIDEIVAAFAVYCATSGICAGPQGEPGTAGAQGAPGPSGAQGEPGTPGAPGAPGVGIVSIGCVTTDLGTVFRFGLSDGTYADVLGECRDPAVESPGQ